VTFPSRDGLTDFVYDEAPMIDEDRFEEWLGLWAAYSYY
jgi:3-phenylpropionate/cinnamic acid dioxygenase small subunit